jgi:hypothetical protein
MEIIKFIILCLVLSYVGMRILYDTTPLKEKLSKVKLFGICVAIYCTIDVGVHIVNL